MKTSCFEIPHMTMIFIGCLFTNNKMLSTEVKNNVHETLVKFAARNERPLPSVAFVDDAHEAVPRLGFARAVALDALGDFIEDASLAGPGRFGLQ